MTRGRENEGNLIMPESEAGRKYYYVSLPFYGHRIFKCAGFGAEKAWHLEFYRPYFERFGASCVGPADGKYAKDKEAAGPYEVKIVDGHRGNLIDEDGNEIGSEAAIAKYRREVASHAAIAASKAAR